MALPARLSLQSSSVTWEKTPCEQAVPAELARTLAVAMEGDFPGDGPAAGGAARHTGGAPGPGGANHDRLARGGGYDDTHRDLLRALVGEQRRHRNRPDGYWIAEATPHAAGHAITRSWPRVAVTTALLASDGVSRGSGRAVPDWAAALRLVRERGPDALLDAVRAPEQADPEGRHWPRSKPYDDQALVVVTFLDGESVSEY